MSEKITVASLESKIGFSPLQIARNFGAIEKKRQSNGQLAQKIGELIADEKLTRQEAAEVLNLHNAECDKKALSKSQKSYIWDEMQRSAREGTRFDSVRENESKDKEGKYLQVWSRALTDKEKVAKAEKARRRSADGKANERDGKANERGAGERELATVQEVLQAMLGSGNSAPHIISELAAVCQIQPADRGNWLRQIADEIDKDAADRKQAITRTAAKRRVQSQKKAKAAAAEQAAAKPTATEQAAEQAAA